MPPFTSTTLSFTVQKIEQRYNYKHFFFVCYIAALKKKVNNFAERDQLEIYILHLREIQKRYI